MRGDILFMEVNSYLQKIIVALVMLGAIPGGPSIAQVNLDFSAGINLSRASLRNVAELEFQNRTGYFIGIAPGYRITERFNVQLGAQYSVKGYKPNFPAGSEFSIYRMSYWNIMPEIEYEFLQSLSVGVGAYRAFLAVEDFKIGNSDWMESSIGETVKSTDYGLMAKLKYNFRDIFAYVRYEHGLKDVALLEFTDINGNLIEDARQLNRNIQFGLGYTFGYSGN